MTSTAVEAVEKTGGAAVKVGQVFGQGGTDGLILYALILATFLMFLALVIIAVMSFRTIARASGDAKEQATAFAEASNETAGALRELAKQLAATGAANAAHAISIAATLARVESILCRIEPVPGGGEHG